MKTFFSGLKSMLSIYRNTMPEAALKTNEQQIGPVKSGNGEVIMKTNKLLKCHPKRKVLRRVVNTGAVIDHAPPVQAAVRPKTTSEAGSPFRDWLADEDRRYSRLPSLFEVAAKENIGVRALYQRLHGEGILYRRRPNGRSEQGGNFGFLFIYAEYSRMDLFMTARSPNDECLQGPTTAATLKVTRRGQDLIRQLIKIPSAKVICRQLSKVK